MDKVTKKRVISKENPAFSFDIRVPENFNEVKVTKSRVKNKMCICNIFFLLQDENIFLL